MPNHDGFGHPLPAQGRRHLLIAQSVAQSYLHVDCRQQLQIWATAASSVLGSEVLNIVNVRRLGLHLVDGEEHAGGPEDYAVSFMTKVLKEVGSMHPFL